MCGGWPLSIRFKADGGAGPVHVNHPATSLEQAMGSAEAERSGAPVALPVQCGFGCGLLCAERHGGTVAERSDAFMSPSWNCRRSLEALHLSRNLTV